MNQNIKKNLATIVLGAGLSLGVANSADVFEQGTYQVAPQCQKLPITYESVTGLSEYHYPIMMADVHCSLRYNPNKAKEDRQNIGLILMLGFVGLAFHLTCTGPYNGLQRLPRK